MARSAGPFLRGLLWKTLWTTQRHSSPGRVAAGGGSFGPVRRGWIYRDESTTWAYLEGAPQSVPDGSPGTDILWTAVARKPAWNLDPPTKRQHWRGKASRFRR